jgi:TPR repeat protein
MAKSLLRARIRAGVIGKAADAASDWASGVGKTHGEDGPLARATRAAAALLQSRADAGAEDCFKRGMSAWDSGDRYGADRWFLLAAKQGHAAAMCNLGYLCESGWGVRGKEDYAGAVKWYTLAANSGNAQAAKNLGMLLLIGFRGVPQNRAEGLRWVHVAAERGNDEAKAILYDLERNTRGATGQGGSSANGNGAGGQQQQSSRRAKMTRADALDIFDLKEGATREQIKAAYHRLLQQVHPDKGGSNHFARELNEARDVLLG